MLTNITAFMLNWAMLALALWVASHVFRGVTFDNRSSLAVSALLLGFANAIVRPLVVLLTLPLTLVTFVLFVLVINALMILLVSALVRGFRISGFWTAFFASNLVSVVSFLTEYFLTAGGPTALELPSGGTWM
jgi:putative membrane protein